MTNTVKHMQSIFLERLTRYAQAGIKTGQRVSRLSFVVVILFALSACSENYRSSNYDPEEIVPNLAMISDPESGTTTAKLSVSLGSATPGGFYAIGDSAYRLTNSDHFTLTRNGVSKILYRRVEAYQYQTQFEGIGQQSYTLAFRRRGVLDNIDRHRSYTVASTPSISADFTGTEQSVGDMISFTWQPGATDEILSTVSLRPAVSSCINTAGSTLQPVDVFADNGLTEIMLDQSNPDLIPGSTITVELNSLFARKIQQTADIVSCQAKLQIAVAIDEYIDSLSPSIDFTLQGAGL